MIRVFFSSARMILLECYESPAPIAMEGPYSDESKYYLNYKTLVLVAGGIEITPFMTIIQGILHRYRITTHKERVHLPKNIVLLCRFSLKLSSTSSVKFHRV